MNINSKFTKFMQGSREKIRQLTNLQDSYKLLEKKYRTILQCARQIFSTNINCLELLQNLKNGKKINDLEKTIEEYKNQIGKYHKIIMSNEWEGNTITINKAIITEHKNKLKNKKNSDEIIEVFLSLRVNALQTSPELRRNLIDLYIENDILQINQNPQYIIDILNTHAYNLRHAILSFVSIIASTFNGAEYLMKCGENLIQKIIEIMKTTEDGQVLQRFCIAILQKISVLDEIIPIYLKLGLMDWIVKLLQRAKKNNIHIFCINFASGLIANILKANETLEFIEKNVGIYKNLSETFFSLIKEKIPSSALMNILVCLKYLGKERFKNQKDECKFNNKIEEFKDYFKRSKTNSESEEIDKKIIIDLCEQMFNQNDENVVEKSKEEKIKEYEAQQGYLIFECFQDEIN